MIKQLAVHTRAQGLLEVTRIVAEAVAQAGVAEGLCTIFVRHTSASLVIQENADPTAKQDLERWLNRLVPEGDPSISTTLKARTTWRRTSNRR